MFSLFSTFLGHGVGTLADLPLPVLYVVLGGGLAVVVSFLALGLLWREPRLGGAEAGRQVPAGLARLVDRPAALPALRAVTLALTLLVLTVALIGPREVPSNLAPWTFYITFWVGMVPVCLLFGPVWSVLNPLATISRALRPPGRPCATGRQARPARVLARSRLAGRVRLGRARLTGPQRPPPDRGVPGRLRGGAPARRRPVRGPLGSPAVTGSTSTPS